MRPLGVAAVAVLTATVALTGCESEAQKEAEKQLGQTTSLTTCVAKASAAPTPYPAGFPSAWPFPAGTVVVNAEDRGSAGVVVSAVSSTGFKDVLGFMNGPVSDQGFRVTQGETEEHDAEANWTGNGFHGRWAIKESATCPGETTIQVLSTNG